MELTFNSSELYSIGVEIEAQLVDTDKFSLTPTSDEILNDLKDRVPSIKHELLRSNIEINTKVCTDIYEAQADLKGKFSLVLEKAREHNTVIACSSTHPFSSWKDQFVSTDDRYKRLVDKLQLIARRFNIFGLHVHVGLGDKDKCIYVLNSMVKDIPLLLALSANSPFWEGLNSGLMSYRTKVFEALPTGGLPLYFDSWDDYHKLIKAYIKSRTIETVREIWWDIRPHPDFGTLEVRVCDVPLTISESLSIASLIQSLTKKYSEDYDKGVDCVKAESFELRENKWRAVRWGMEAEFLEGGMGKTKKAKVLLSELVSDLKPHITSLGIEKYINDLVSKKECGAVRQLNAYKKNNSFEYLMEYMVKEFEDDLRSL